MARYDRATRILDPEWASLPLELLHEVAGRLPSSQLCCFALVCRSWRQATLPLVTTLHAPMTSEVTLPTGPPGMQRLEVVRRYLSNIKSTNTPSNNSSGALPPSQPSPSSPTSPPLLPSLLKRFPFVRTLGLHRSSLQHPAFEAAALQSVAACQPQVTQLHLYDTLAWDFPQQLPNLAGMTQLVTLKLWGLGAPGLDVSAQWSYSRGLMALSSLTRLQELTLRWLFGRQEVVWTCPTTPRLVRALTDGGCRLRSLDLNAFLLDPGAAASLARVSSLRSLSLYFDAEAAGWEQAASLMSLPELTRLILSYEGDAMAGPWVGDGPPADEPPPPPAAAAAAVPPNLGAGAAAAGGGGGAGAVGGDGHQHNHATPGAANGAGSSSAAAPSSGSSALPLHPLTSAAAGTTSSGGGSSGNHNPHISAAAAAPAAASSSTPRRRLPSWAARPYSLQYLSLTTSPALHPLLGRMDVLLPHLTYLSLSSVGEFGSGQKELEAGLMAMAQAGSRLSRIKLFCMELRPELLASLTALPCLQELMLFNVWVALEPQPPAAAAAAAALPLQAAAAAAAAAALPLQAAAAAAAAANQQPPQHQQQQAAAAGGAGAGPAAAQAAVQPGEQQQHQQPGAHANAALAAAAALLADAMAAGGSESEGSGEGGDDMLTSSSEGGDGEEQGDDD
ncbi:hypothetical protein Agub_g10889, partial [Astrephomene gubernaculifera]